MRFYDRATAGRRLRHRMDHAMSLGFLWVCILLIGALDIALASIWIWWLYL